MAVSRNKLKAAVEDYFAELRRIRSTGGGTGELSYYPPLSNLLNAVGGSLRPRVYCVSQLAQQGAGHPDFGLCAARQVSKGQPKRGQTPEGGVVEVKPASDDAWITADSAQVSRILGPLPASAGDQHPRFRSARRGRPRPARQVGDLPAGRLCSRLRG